MKVFIIFKYGVKILFARAKQNRGNSNTILINKKKIEILSTEEKKVLTTILTLI